MIACSPLAGRAIAYPGERARPASLCGPLPRHVAPDRRAVAGQTVRVSVARRS